MNRMFVAACLVALATIASAQEKAGGHGQPPGARVEELLALARERSPEFAASRLEAEAASERIYPAGALTDPMLRTELRDITNRGSDAAPSLLPNRVGSTRYLVSQAVPFFGKRDLKRDVAAAEAEQAKGAAADTWLDLATRIKGAYAQYWQASRSETLTRELLDLTEHLGMVAQVRYANGQAAQQDVVRAQVERSSLQSELIGVETERHHMMTQLNTLLARPGNAPLAEPRQLRPVPSPATLEWDGLTARLQARNPQLAIAAAGVTAADKGRELTYKNRYPDFNLGVSPIQNRNQINEWEVMVELNIPLQQESRRSQERESERKLEAARARQDAVANRLMGDLSSAVSALEAARRIERLTSEALLPQAQVTFQSALAGYETGKVDFATLLDAQRQIRKSKLDIIKAQAEQQLRLADIERLVGEEE
ncbi:MAG TPA: TolC family protein [Azospira sp.]|nr:TolC family protein [Azospira sp.]